MSIRVGGGKTTSSGGTGGVSETKVRSLITAALSGVATDAELAAAIAAAEAMDLTTDQVNDLITASLANYQDGTQVTALLNALDKRKANLSGATFTGAVKGIAPTEDTNFATKKYVDDNAGGSGGSVLSIGQIQIHPGRISRAEDLDGIYQIDLALSGAELKNLTDAGVNYLEIWFGTETVQVVTPWVPALASRIDINVSTAEETQIGSPGQSLIVRAVYRINQSGSQTYHAEGSTALRIGGYAVEEAGDTFQLFPADSAAKLSQQFGAHNINDDAAIIQITADFTTRVRSYKVGQRYYLAPHHGTELFMVLIADYPDAVELPPFAEIKLLPGALPGSQVPENFYVELTDRLTKREIDGLSLNIQGLTFTPHSSTPLSDFDTEEQALVRFDISSKSDEITNGIGATEDSLTVDLTFSFTEGDNYRRRIVLAVNNPNAPRLVVGELDSITYNAAIILTWRAPDMRTITLTGNVTFSFADIQVGRPIVIEVIQDSTGGRTITWPSSVEWAGGSAEGPSSGANAKDIFTLLPLSSTRVIASALLNVS